MRQKDNHFPSYRKYALNPILYIFVNYMRYYICIFDVSLKASRLYSITSFVTFAFTLYLKTTQRNYNKLMLMLLLFFCVRHPLAFLQFLPLLSPVVIWQTYGLTKFCLLDYRIWPLLMDDKKKENLYKLNKC